MWVLDFEVYILKKKKKDQSKEHRIIKWGRGITRRDHEEKKNYSLYKPEKMGHRQDYRFFRFVFFPIKEREQTFPIWGPFLPRGGHPAQVEFVYASNKLPHFY